MGQRCRTMENQKLGRGLVRDQDFVEGEGLELKVKLW